MKWFHEMIGTAETAIRPLDAAMAREAADIHAVTFARGWTDGEIANLLHQGATFGYTAFPASGSSTGDTSMIGFVLARGAAGEAEVLTIAGRPDWQGYGVGRRLMDHLRAHAHRDRLEAVFLEVEDTNQPALALYNKLAFAPVGDRPGYYGGDAGQRGRAIVMRRPINRAAPGR